MCITLTPFEGAHRLCMSGKDINYAFCNKSYTLVCICNHIYKVKETLESIVAMVSKYDSDGCTLLNLSRRDNDELLVNIYDIMDVRGTTDGTVVEMSGGKEFDVCENAEDITESICSVFCQNMKKCS